jgi:hypothetical protein
MRALRSATRSHHTVSPGVTLVRLAVITSSQVILSDSTRSARRVSEASRMATFRTRHCVRRREVVVEALPPFVRPHRELCRGEGSADAPRIRASHHTVAPR